MPAAFLESDRLLLRPVRPSDAAAFFAFLGDPAAMRFTRCHASLRACGARLAGFEWRRRRTGMAPWAVIAKAGFTPVRFVPEMNRTLHRRRQAALPALVPRPPFR